MAEPEHHAKWSALADHASGLRGAVARRYPWVDADDVTQEALLRAMRSNTVVRQGPPMMRWLRTIARNVAIDIWRHRRHDVALDLAAHVPAIVTDRDRVLDVERALSHLSRSDRRLLVSVAVGIGYDELARLERTNAAAIRQRVARARGRLLQLVVEGRR